MTPTTCRSMRGEPSPVGRGQGEGSAIGRFGRGLTAVSLSGNHPTGPGAYTSPLPLSLQERGSPRLAVARMEGAI
ncbi:hypothetical protein SAMN05216304_11171 [Bosea sp. OK403]|nr:hypothetical protein SAMN05216304_11171 [Bosea sp. OK403]